MSDEAPRPQPPATPFDNPWFLPVVLWGFAAWFGWDAFFNRDEHMQVPTTLWFNRIGFPILAALASWYTRDALREQRKSAARRTAPPAAEA